MDIENLIQDHRDTVVSQLPGATIELLNRIEEFANARVVFRDTIMLKSAGGGSKADVEALYVDHERAYLSLPNPHNINANAVLHELLHLHRYWVESVPLIEPKKDIGKNVEFAANLDNDLEHLVIVPIERTYGYNPEPYWTELSKKYWQNYPWDYLPVAIKREQILKGWLHSPLISSEMRDTLQTKLLSDGMLNEAERFRQRIHDLLHSKPRAVSAALRFLKIPRDEVHLVNLDIRNRRKSFSEVPTN